MDALRKLVVLTLLVFAVIGVTSGVAQAEPSSPEGGCYWSGTTCGAGVCFGAYSCENGCDYTYAYRNGSWSQTGTYCGGGGGQPPAN